MIQSRHPPRHPRLFSTDCPVWSETMSSVFWGKKNCLCPSGWGRGDLGCATSQRHILWAGRCKWSYLYVRELNDAINLAHFKVTGPHIIQWVLSTPSHQRFYTTFKASHNGRSILAKCIVNETWKKTSSEHEILICELNILYLFLLLTYYTSLKLNDEIRRNSTNLDEIRRFSPVWNRRKTRTVPLHM